MVLDNIHGNLSLKGEDGGDVKVTGRKTVAPSTATTLTARNYRVRSAWSARAICWSSGPKSPQYAHAFGDDGSRYYGAAGLNVEARGRNGDLTVEDIDGAVDVSSGHGDVRLNNIGKDVKIESSRTGWCMRADLKGNLDLQGRGGDVQMEKLQGQVTINGEYSGTLEFRGLSKPLHFQSSRSDFRAEQIPGSVTIDLGDVKMNNVIGPVRFETASRDIQATDVTNSLELTVDRGDIQVTQTKTPLPKMESVRGTGILR